MDQIRRLTGTPSLSPKFMGNVFRKIKIINEVIIEHGTARLCSYFGFISRLGEFSANATTGNRSSIN